MSAVPPASSRRGQRGAGSVTPIDLAFVLAIGAIGALALVTGSRGETDPLAALVWITLIAPALGFACGARALPIWPLAPVPPALWVLAIGIADAGSRRDLPSLALGAAAVGGLFAFGFGLGRCLPALLWRGTASLLFLSVLASALPLAGLVLRTPLSARVSARLLDLSPVTLVAECAGVDWMRHPPIYDGAATVDVDPTLRSPYSGRLAASLVFVVGCVLAVSLDRAARRRAARAT